MINYNTQLPKLKLPEYGRNIQQMVDKCAEIADRDERNACAHTIIKAMALLAPSLKESGEEGQRKLWDHLAIMSDFKLDIDYPFPVIQQEELATKPDPVGYVQQRLSHRNYGRHIIDMINAAVEMEGGDDKDALISLIANQMKKDMAILSGSDNIDDHRIFNDMYTLSHGQIRLTEESCLLHDYDAPAPVTGKKKKKKNKNNNSLL